MKYVFLEDHGEEDYWWISAKNTSTLQIIYIHDEESRVEKSFY